MLSKVVYTTKDHEIHIKKKDNGNWGLDIYEINHSTKEIIERHELKHYTSAIVFVEEKYLKTNSAVV